MSGCDPSACSPLVLFLLFLAIIVQETRPVPARYAEVKLSRMAPCRADFVIVLFFRLFDDLFYLTFAFCIGGADSAISVAKGAGSSEPVWELRPATDRF